jgi:hypothetical protein
MPDDDAFADRRRASEEDYFRKKDRELVEKLRQAAAGEQARLQMAAKTGLDDPEMLKELQALGFSPETVSLLPLVPVVQVAWAEGGVSDAERRLVLELARTRGIAEGSVADRQLSEWLSRRPDPQVFVRAMRLIAAMLGAPSDQRGDLSADDLVRYCEQIAAASGGILGIYSISAEERALLTRIATELKGREG